MNEPEPAQNHPLSSWLADRIVSALNAGDVATALALIGDHLELNALQVPAEAIASLRARGLLGEPTDGDNSGERSLVERR